MYLSTNEICAVINFLAVNRHVCFELNFFLFFSILCAFYACSMYDFVV